MSTAYRLRLGPEVRQNPRFNRALIVLRSVSPLSCTHPRVRIHERHEQIVGYPIAVKLRQIEHRAGTAVDQDAVTVVLHDRPEPGRVMTVPGTGTGFHVKGDILASGDLQGA